MENLKEEFDNYLTGIAWNAWRELGVAGTTRCYANCLIQPEELIILTAMLSQHDPRLRDEALDWSSRYHEYISVTRLRTLLKDMDVDTTRSFSQFASTLNSISSAKWPVIEEVDPLTTKMSGKSILPSLESPSLLVFRLRSLFGPGARADVLTHLLTKSHRHFLASDLIEVGYTKRSLITVLDHLAASGLVTVTNARNLKVYELKKSKELQVIIGRLPKIAPPWTKILKAIVVIRATISEIQNSAKLTKNVTFRNCLIKIEPLLPYFISPILQHGPDFTRDWKSAMEIFKGLKEGNFFMQFEVQNDLDTEVIRLLRDLYPVDDCIDGLEMIFDKTKFRETQYNKIYKECYQLFLSFINDLNVSLNRFLEFPIHKMMDVSLAEVCYSYSKEQFPQLLKKMNNLPSIDHIVDAQSTIRQFQMMMPEFEDLKQFLRTFRKHLEDLYFIKTDIYLLSDSATLYKRELVLDLFSTKT